MALASSRLNRPFSSSSTFSLRACSTSMPSQMQGTPAQLLSGRQTGQRLTGAAALLDGRQGTVAAW